LTIVCDAKYYTSEIPDKIIDKTLDDMRLRNTNYGILICSEDTKTDKIKQNVRLLKLLKADF